MALPPIITNSPIFKVITGNQTRATPAQDAPAKTPSSKQDSVSLSDESIRKNEALQADVRDSNEARDAAASVRQGLEANTNIALGYSEAEAS